MQEKINRHLNDFTNLLKRVECTGSDGSPVGFASAMAGVCSLVLGRTGAGGTVLFIGNGGSAAISGHMAIDFWKNGGMRALAFNDGPLLTCIGNDFGYERVFEKPIDMFAGKDDVLFAISSSGRSENIFNGVRAAVKKGVSVVTLSGFGLDNQLRTMGSFNFYVPAMHYGHVEVIHQYLCHCLLDMIVENRATGPQPK